MRFVLSSQIKWWNGDTTLLLWKARERMFLRHTTASPKWQDRKKKPMQKYHVHTPHPKKGCSPTRFVKPTPSHGAKYVSPAPSHVAKLHKPLSDSHTWNTKHTIEKDDIKWFTWGFCVTLIIIRNSFFYEMFASPNSMFCCSLLRFWFSWFPISCVYCSLLQLHLVDNTSAILQAKSVLIGQSENSLVKEKCPQWVFSSVGLVLLYF